MHHLEPHFLWRDIYKSEEDINSPFFEREYSEFDFTNQVYNYLLHPQWDAFGTPTLFIKILFADYDKGFLVAELIGEWNDALHNDIMFLKRDVMEVFIENGIDKFILIGENVLNFHASDDSYYEDWFQDIDDTGGWIAAVNFQEHVLTELRNNNIDYYLNFGGELDSMNWRTFSPFQLYQRIKEIIGHRLN